MQSVAEGPDQAGTAARDSVIAMEGVSFSYDHVPAVEHATLEIRSREFVCIVGPNGGGKTTLLRLILGLARPQTGQVRVFGGRPEAARSRLGYMPQRAHLDPKFPVRVLDVVLTGCLGPGHLFGPYRQADREAGGRVLREVGIEELADRPFSDLSGGQRQRALIARALVSNPDLLLLDEPTANVDPLGERQLYDLFHNLNQRLTIVLATHDLSFVTSQVEKVICVNRRVLVHPTHEITGEIIREVYGDDVRLVRHNHRGFAGDPSWASS